MPPTNIQIPDRVLSWLHSSLQREYRDVARTYSDVARALSSYPQVQPQTDVYTSENGSSALLLELKGLFPVNFRGTTYRFPIAVWIPHAYPLEPPTIFVTPTADLAVRPGQHVSVEGRIYHPYLAQWQSHWDRSNLLDCLAILGDVFAKEPPLVARGPAPQPRSNPLAQVNGHTGTSLQASPSNVQSPQPPPPPPKPPEAGGIPRRQSSLQHSRIQSSEVPPVPPKPRHELGTDERPAPQADPSISGLPQHSQVGYSLSPPSQQRPEPFPQHSHLTHPAMQHSPNQSPVSDPAHQSLQQGISPTLQTQQQIRHLNQAQQHPSNYNQLRSAPQYQQVPPTIVPKPKQAPVDLLSLDAQPLSTTPPPAPPIPPNPEKDALLQTISSHLLATLSQALNRNAAALPALQAQSTALHHSLQNMHTELDRLRQLDATLTSNERILSEATRAADKAIQDAATRKEPNIDEVLVAPNVVGEQLYKVVADVRGIEEAMFSVAKGLERGRIDAGTFVRVTRQLAREQFLAKALAGKIAVGMGLEGVTRA